MPSARAYDSRQPLEPNAVCWASKQESEVDSGGQHGETVCGSGVGGKGRGTGVERDGGSMTVNTGTVGRGRGRARN